MEFIKRIDRELTSLFVGFERSAQELEFTRICELDDEPTIALQKYPGIYLIEMKVGEVHHTIDAWKTWFQEEWVRPEYERMHVPNPKKVRLRAHTTLLEWMPLYIGKASNIADRVSQHLHLELERPTTAMKLRSRTNLVGQRFRLSTVRVEVENYDLLMARIESALREKHHPVLGRQ